MELILGRSLTPRSIETMVEYAYETEWNDLLPFLMMAADGPLTIGDVNRHLLFRPEGSPHGKMVLSELECRGLLQKGGSSGQYSLTSSGRRALQRDSMRIRRRCACRILWTDDPLFRYPVLSLAEVHRTAKDLERDARGRRRREMPTPREIMALKGRSLTIPLQGMEVEIIDLSPVSLEAHTDEIVQVEVRDDDFGSIVLVTSDRNSTWGRVEPSTEIDALGSLLAEIGLSLEEDGDDGIVVPLGSDQVLPEELGSFSLSASRFGLPSLKGLGCFEYVEMNGVGIRPRTEDDAVDWANALLHESYRTDMDDDHLDVMREEIASRFSQWYRPGILLLMMDGRDELAGCRDP